MVAVGALRSFAASGRKASRHSTLTTMNSSACTRNRSVNRQLINAAAAPMANQMEVILKVQPSSTRKPTAAMSQKNGAVFMGNSLLMALL